VADACGSLVEFSPKEFPKHSDVETILSMPGGGPWKLSAGQITDDSELATALMLALIESDKNTMDVEKIASHYRNWLGTPPLISAGQRGNVLAN